jgi:hypothetical protein
MTFARKAIAPFLLLIVIAALACTMQNFQMQTAEAQTNAIHLQNQLLISENSSRALQAQVDSLEAQLLSLQNPTYNVTITDISSEPWYVPVGVAMFKQISITVKNIGVRDVGGVTFEFRLLEDGRVWNSESYEIAMIAPDQLGILHVGESIIVKAEIRSGLNVSFAGKTSAVTVMLDNTVLSEGTLPLSAGFFSGS